MDGHVLGPWAGTSQSKHNIFSTQLFSTELRGPAIGLPCLMPGAAVLVELAALGATRAWPSYADEAAIHEAVPTAAGLVVPQELRERH